MSEVPTPPSGLREAGLRFWERIHSTYEFPDAPDAAMIVEEAAKTADVVARLQAVVDEAETLRARGSRNQDVAIPELSELRFYRAQFAALVKQLDLPAAEDESKVDRQTARVTPMSRSESGRLAAQARWDRRYVG